MDLITLEYIIENRASLLAELTCQQAVMQDFVRSVALQYALGGYFWGPPRMGKTRIIREVLETEIREPYVYKRGNLAPMGLFDLLDQHPDEVIVLDDLLTIYRSEVGLQLLLAALERPAERDRSRVIEYQRQGMKRRISFRGGIVCIANRELQDGDMLGAFKSRAHVFNYDPPDAQLGALLLDIAQRGGGESMPGIKPEESLEVAKHVIGEMLRLGCRFDLRLYCDKALPLYQLWKDDEAESDWKVLVTAAIEQHITMAQHQNERPSRASRKEQEHAILREILQQYSTREERVRAWSERTGKSQRAYHRRLAELQ
jgi:hypothetical protein